MAEKLCNLLKSGSGSGDWKLVGSASGAGASVNNPSKFSELYAFVLVDGFGIGFSHFIPKPIIPTSGSKYMRQGYYINSSTAGFSDLEITPTTTKVGPLGVYINGSSRTDITLYLYYR